jgi:hypothetical protein
MGLDEAFGGAAQQLRDRFDIPIGEADLDMAQITRSTSSGDKPAGTADWRYVRTIGTAADRSRGVSPRRNRKRSTERRATVSSREDSDERLAMRSRRKTRTASASKASSARLPAWLTR